MKLLIIDDDKIFTVITTWVAKNSGIFTDIQSVPNGRDAVDIFEHVCKGTMAAPDLILLDLNMPLMNGFDLIEYIKDLTFPNKKSMSIVILTSSDNRIDIERAKSLGVEHYLLKSLSLKDLQSSLLSLYRNTRTDFKCYKGNVAVNPAA